MTLFYLVYGKAAFITFRFQDITGNGTCSDVWSDRWIFYSKPKCIICYINH